MKMEIDELSYGCVNIIFANYYHIISRNIIIDIYEANNHSSTNTHTCTPKIYKHYHNMSHDLYIQLLPKI